ncbi:hypothetical protein DMA11_00700 [Marinilabiliaceae bacterium JC017]|nr:hypothetical protein DMA11_00700 [Marinilabiliaceae bacterium JC017]
MKSKKAGKKRTDFTSDEAFMKRYNAKTGKSKRNRKPTIYDIDDFDDNLVDEDFKGFNKDQYNNDLY